jgi:hypothetical protein
MMFATAQADMRHAYFGGATGVTTSALAWLAAAATALLVSPRGAIAALFIGGMFIHPGAILLSKLLGRPGAHDKDNPLARLAVESTIWLLLAIAVAFIASFQGAEWFFVAMLLTIGGRYFLFATLYGLRMYWVCGAVLALAGIALAALKAGAATIALTGGLLELAFAAAVFARERK